MLYPSIYRDCCRSSLRKQTSQATGKTKKGSFNKNVDRVLYQSNYRDCNMDVVHKRLRGSMERWVREKKDQLANHIGQSIKMGS